MKRFVLGAAIASCAGAGSGMVIDPVDPAFGVAIVEFVRAPYAELSNLRGLAFTAEGRVAVLALEQPSAESHCRVATLVMLQSSGAIDIAFAEQGRATAARLGLPPCLSPETVALAIDAADSIYVTGSDPVQQPRLWKASRDGVPDLAFGNAGSVPLPVAWILRPTIVVLPDGGIAVGGVGLFVDALGQHVPKLTVVRLRPDGTPDASYGTLGVASAAPSIRPVYLISGGGMAVNADGSALVLGNIFDDDGGARLYLDAAVARFDAAGRLDTSYGDEGFAIPLRDASTFAQSLAVRNGEAYLAGVQSRDVNSMFVAKIKTDGQLDLAFANAGIAGTDRFGEIGFDPVVAVDNAGRVYYRTSDLARRPRITRLRSDGQVDSGFGLEGTAYVAAAGWQVAGPGLLRVAADGRVYLGISGFFAEDLERTGIGVARLTESGGHRAGIAGGTAIVYHNPSLDHYFMTANPGEQSLLDSGATRGWQRTGSEFRVVTSVAAVSGLSPVCRFYGRPEAQLDSHFFSAAPDECAAVVQKFSASWLLETSQAFQVHLPDRATGMCPRGSERAHRAFNNRADANHYYGTLPAAPAGWTYEGYGAGPYPAAFCAPLL